MNNVLELKGRFESGEYRGRVGSPSLPKGKYVEINHFDELVSQLIVVKNYWEKNTLIGGALVSVHYSMVVAKSNRIREIFRGRGEAEAANSKIRGAKFKYINEDKKNPHHVFTYFVSMDILSKTIEKLSIVKDSIVKDFGDKITDEQLNEAIKKHYKAEGLCTSAFAQLVVDAYYVERFDIDISFAPKDENVLVTFYKTDMDISELLSSVGINLVRTKMLDDNTFILNREEQEIIKSRFPYLVAMSIVDLAEIDSAALDKDIDNEIVTIPEPNNEPYIGVIDTQFDDTVYFHKWVESCNMIPEDISITAEDRIHGTEICSIIVDGPTINPELDDGCGRFRVKHFGVATGGKFSAFSVMRNIEEAVKSNPDIKVWNISLGSIREVEDFFISPAGALLDRLESEYDIIFVVAGTNKPRNIDTDMRIGSPADSLNSLVVNSVDFDDNPASYTRTGPVLSFFHKPDLSYYGGDKGKGIRVCNSMGEGIRVGTSFAAPWISRKMAYLICRMGLSREAAKALLIDSAAGWNRRDDSSFKIGYGVVPKRIEEIIKSRDDEIRFIITNKIADYETYTYNLPIPRNEKGFPFVARATLVYFPRCDRNQGVDYTCTEFDIHFGRLKESDGKVVIESINNNSQGDEGGEKNYEGSARRLYRKWDNVKHISERYTSRTRTRTVFGTGLWGLMIRNKERLDAKYGRGLRFGVVVTLKEIDGINRIQDFVNMCRLKGWIVNRLDVENLNIVYNMADETIEWE